MPPTVGSASKSSPFADRRARLAAGMLGMRLFLVSLGVLFGAVLVGYLVIRLQPTAEPAPEIPPLPAGLWLSTVLMLISSVTMQWALGAARRDRHRQLRVGMAATTLLGLAFLGTQTVCWIQWSGPLTASLDEVQKAFVLTGFYVLTGVHALHVIGGLIPLAAVTIRSFRNRYSSTDHAAVRYCAMYWHFLDGVWLVLFATLMLGT